MSRVFNPDQAPRLLGHREQGFAPLDHVGGQFGRGAGADVADRVDHPGRDGQGFPGEVIPGPRSWVEKVYPTLSYFNEAERGGHFAAWEEPELFATEIRAAFRSLR